MSLGGAVWLHCELGAQGNYTLKYEDFSFGVNGGAGNTYFGYMLRKVNTTTVYYITRSVTISTEWGTNISIPAASASPLLNNTWQVFPFLSNTAVTTLSTNQNQTGIFIALLDPVTIALNQVYADYTLNFIAAWYDTNTDPRNVYYSFILKNNETSYNLTNITVTINFLKQDLSVVATQTQTKTSLTSGSTWSVDDYYRASSNSIAASIKYVQVLVTAMDQSFVQQGETKQVTIGPSPF